MELLPDPCKDRFVKNCPLPPHKPLPETLLYHQKGTDTTTPIIISISTVNLNFYR